MAQKADETPYSTTSETSPAPNSPMGTPLRKVFDRIFDFAAPWRGNPAPRGRRIFHRDVEQEEFQYASTHCLSSYYSVFVVRLAIMVGLNFFISLLLTLSGLYVSLLIQQYQFGLFNHISRIKNCVKLM